jgi:thiosulfate dehydrogenase [quinone] large subunit
MSESRPSPTRVELDRLVARLARDPRWILLVLRGYLAFTFLYAGLSKIADRSFLSGSSPTSIHATLLAVKGQSPIGGLLGPVESHSFAFGLLMAFGEIAVGIGMALGLFARIAALGGMLISLSLFLTVSWDATPWYTGADIVYLFAFTPLLLGGAGPLSADAWTASEERGRPGSAGPADERGRRLVLGGIAGFVGLAAVGAAALARGSRSSPAAADPPGDPAPHGPTIIAASDVPVGGAKPAKDPKTGDDIYVLQLQDGAFTALDSRCPHQGCTVSFVSKSAGFACPCHGSRFAASGALRQGPATRGLTKVPVAKSGDDIVRA